jgi:hexosaminidase
MAARAATNDSALVVSWRLIGNDDSGRYQCELKLTNAASDDLTSNWKLYFNSPAKLVSESISRGFELTHINGDFYVLRPLADSPPLKSGESHTIRWEGEPWAINVSDAPSGFYLVRNTDTERPTTPVAVPCSIGPFPEASKLNRGAADLVPVVTAESRYHANEHLELLPAEQLNRVVPSPVFSENLPGQLLLGKSTKVFHDRELMAEAEFLMDALAAVSSERLESASDDAEPSTKNSIRLRIGELKVRGVLKHAGDEAYTLSVHPEDGIELVGTDPAGVFYGIQTLRALLPISCWRRPADELEIAAIRIADAPRFHYRGLHLDVARNFQTPDSVMKLLDVMAFYKLNRFHLHLTDDEGWRIQIKQLPELTAVGSRRGHTLDESECLIPSYGSGPVAEPKGSGGTGFYSQDDLVRILQYANARHIEVMPEVDFPGHARAAIISMRARSNRLAQTNANAAAEFLLTDPRDQSKYESVQMWRDNVVDVGREATYRFLDVVFSELADIYKRAGVPLRSIHLGGDEVPKGAWEKSPSAAAITVDKNLKIPRSGQLEIYFLQRAAKLLSQRGIQPACWDDCLLLQIDDATKLQSARSDSSDKLTAYVWNSVWGWGIEDAAYRLANAGYDVVLCNAPYLYFDLAYEKDPLEPGYYWAGFVDARAPFEFAPLDLFQNANRDGMGHHLDSASFANRTRLTAEGAQHILGIQGQLWSENIRTAEALEYMAIPRLIALAERAWSPSPAWSEDEPSDRKRVRIERDWNQFANRLGQRELPRLDFFAKGVGYRIPSPGAVVIDGRI